MGSVPHARHTKTLPYTAAKFRNKHIGNKDGNKLEGKYRGFT